MESIIIEKFRKLPPQLQEEVVNFIDSLNAGEVQNRKKPNLEWTGGLKAYRDQYTSLELQKKASDWRG